MGIPISATIFQRDMSFDVGFTCARASVADGKHYDKGGL